MLKAKKIISVLFFQLLCFCIHAQVYYNEWIDFSKQYYKFPIAKTGFYRIDSLTLANSGINLSSLNPKNLQLFIRGQEQALYIKGEGDNVLNANDYIEFFAEKNDGRFDSTLYYNISWLPNPYVSLFNDTISGFLTWNSSVANKRFTLETDTASSSYTPAPYVYTEFVSTEKNIYNYVREYTEGVSDPRYTQAEAYGMKVLKGQNITMPFPSVSIYTAAPLPVTLRVGCAGASVDYSFSKDHELKGSINDNLNNPIVLFDTVFLGYKPFNYTFNLQSNTLAANASFQISSVSNPIFSALGMNYSALNFAYYKYPSTPDLAWNKIFNFVIDDDPVQSKTYLHLSGVNVGATSSIIFYDITNSKKIETVIPGVATAKVLVPNSGGQKRCYISSEDIITNVSKLYPVNQTGYFVNYKSTLADSAFVMVSHKSLMAKANNYKNYRQSVTGGSHNVILADIDDLYDQFAWGINTHPLSVRNFCRFLIDSLPSKPAYLFLVGKSVQFDQLNDVASSRSVCLVPTPGVPSSDNIFTAGLKTTDFITPEIPTGRLACQNPTELQWYLDKVMDHENPSLQSAEWRKRVLHFAGGSTVSEQNYFQGCLNNYKYRIQDTLFGGKVFDFKKTTSAPVQITISDSVKNHFSNGVGLVTFFGHGSTTGFDQAIDDPSIYQNAKKYPLMTANSCYSGNIHLYNEKSSSEKFVLINQKGSIGFVASASVGFSNYLCSYSDYFYRALAYEKYNHGIGECTQYATSNCALSGSILEKITALDMTYHGDPAIKVSVGTLPDYMIDNSKVSFDTKTYIDSIGITIDITNLGKAINDSIIVQVERFFPNNDSLTVLKLIRTPLYKDTLKFYMVLDNVRGIGLNKFRVKVDAYSKITESLENNNSTSGTVDLFIQGGDIVPVYPYKYAIIPNTSTLTLKASTSDPFAATRYYKMQLDTTDTFSNPIQTGLVQSSGGVVEWTVSLPFADSTVYYWRVSKDSTGPGSGFVWRESSFQVIGNKHGWGQAHFFQFKNDAYQFVKFKRALRRFDFENDVSSLSARTGFVPYIGWADIQYTLNGSVKHTWCCASYGWSIAVFDSISGKPWIANATTTNAPSFGGYGNCNCVNSSQALSAFDFGYYGCATNPGWQNSLLNFLTAIPNNNYVLAYNAQKDSVSTYSPALKAAFQSIGSSAITTLSDTTCIIIFGRKGMSPGQAHEEVAPNYKSQVSLNDTIKTRWNNGYIASELIGPSYKWNSLHWQVRTLDATPGDSTILKVIGVKKTGQRDTLAVFSIDSLNVLDLYNYADASLYPYLQLVAFESDNVHRTAPQLRRWQVLYDLAPECAINPKKGFKAINDSLQEGDKVTFHIPVENIGTVPFSDSLVITYWIEDANHVNNYLPQKLKAKPFNPQALIIDTVTINSYQFLGDNALWIDVNPTQNSRYQYEQYHFNNIARYPFKVSKDVTNPLLDVTFDGVRIMNGDVVSAKPQILVSLKDENKFLALNDTSDFTVYVKKPGDVTEQKLFFAKDLSFTPAQLPSNSCKINYNPTLYEDGKYMMIVQAKDRSNNQSGAIDYRILFEVVNKPSITQIINYPNPFSTSTRFVFNLTGSEVPETFNIQIMTITGKIVKTITKDELGPLHVGRNITQYAWDGKDDFGDKLGNGVYLYKVQTKLNGQNIERKATEADQYFTKELGKMVIMR